MKDLIKLLEDETQSLRVQFLDATMSYAKRAFASLEKLAASPRPEYRDYVKPPRPRPAGNTDPFWTGQDYEGQKNYRKAVDARDKAKRIIEAGYAAFEARELKLAEQHYQDSVKKLAARIEKKNLDQRNLTIVAGLIGVNFEITLTDGVKKVRAWTIIAAGPVQRPHYRYLVK